jgi:broad specificity phosphatase PhoE
MNEPVLYIARHGASGNDDDYNSPVNPELNAQGIKEAQELAEFFKGKKVGNIYSSVMHRAAQTANILGKALGKKPIMDKDLDALDVGNVSDLKDSDEADRTVRYHQKNSHLPFPGGESIDEIERRVRPQFKAAIKRFHQTGHPDILVAHHSIQYEAGKYFNHDKDSALTELGGALAVYPDSEGALMAEPVYKPLNVEDTLAKRGVDPEKLEEAISPGIHAKMAAAIGPNMKKHKFSHTVIEHHKDGSHTVHHIHEKHEHKHEAPTRDGDVKGAAADHDEMLDHVMDHTSEPNPGEAAATAGDHGVPAGPAAAAGLPAPAAPAAGV